VRAPLLVSVSAALLVGSQAWGDPEEIVPGATYELVEPGDMPARVHLLTLDITASELRFDATEAEGRGVTTSAAASDAGAVIAVNGGPFSPLDFSPYGIAVGGGEAWPDSAPATGSALLLERVGQRTFAELIGPDPGSGGVDGLIGAVAGGPALVEGFAPLADFDCADRLAMPCDRAPRTAVGITGDPDAKLVVAVVDGWQDGSAGATAAELAVLLAARGVREAILLDGGSASTLYAEPLGGLVSSPSDGAERRVANHLLVRFEELEAGQLTVLVRERDISDPDADLAGATVTLDDGREATTDAAGEARFDEVRPRLVCATAEAGGFDPATACRQVPPGGSVLLSIALFPEGEGPAAGEGASAPPPDGSPPRAESAPDRAGDPGWGCRAAPGRLHDDAFYVTLGALLAVTFVAAGARRRKLSPKRRHRR
jgi:hypothetical protein